MTKLCILPLILLFGCAKPEPKFNAGDFVTLAITGERAQVIYSLCSYSPRCTYRVRTSSVGQGIVVEEFEIVARRRK